MRILYGDGTSEELCGNSDEIRKRLYRDFSDHIIIEGSIWPVVHDVPEIGDDPKDALGWIVTDDGIIAKDFSLYDLD